MQLVDWRVAEATATRLVPPGPRRPLADAVAMVDELRELAAQAEGHVRGYTQIDAVATADRVLVVDRPGWIRANVAGFSALADPLLHGVLEHRRSRPGPLLEQVMPPAAGAEVGLLLAYLATRVLGQFDLFGSSAVGGQLLLVAPNIAAAERTLSVDPRDFRLWVCLHEKTHQLQFAAAPWLPEHLRGLLGEYLEASDLDPAALLARAGSALRAVVAGARGGDGASLLELVQTPQQRAVLERVTGVMSLLEGHAEVVMDGVGPAVVGSVRTLRERFERRRRSGNALDRTLRRLLGLDLKMRQYADGARFVRRVVDAVGMPGLNQIWAAPALLPTGAEIGEPDRWLARAGVTDRSTAGSPAAAAVTAAPRPSGTRADEGG